MKNIKLTTVDLKALVKVADKITIRLDNSTNIIDEMNGPEFFYINLNVVNNTIEPVNDKDELSLLEQYTNADYAGIYETYIEWKSFEGMYSISSADNKNKWSLSFQGSEKMDESGELREEERKLIIEILNPKSIYLIADEVLRSCR